MKEDIGERTKSSLFWTTFLPTIFQIYRFAISIAIARLLNPKDFGIMGIASIIIFYTNSLSNFGLGTALIQREKISEKHINSIFTINLSISLLLVIVTIFFSEYVAFFFEIPELRLVFIVLSSMFIVTSFSIMPLNLLKRELRFKIASFAEFYRGFAQTIITLSMALMGYGYWSLVFGLIVSNILYTIYLNYKMKWIPKISYDQKSVKELFNFASWNFLSAQVRLLNDYIDKFIVGKFLGPVFLGYYDKAFSLSFMPVDSISNKMSGVMFSSFSRSQTNNAELKNNFKKSVTASSLICFPILIGLIALAPYFVPVLLSDKWNPMITPLQLLSSAFIFSSLTSIISSLNIGAGNYKTHIKRRIFCLIFMIASCLYFVKWGIDMVAIVIVASNIIFFILSFNLTKQYLPVTWLSFFQAFFPALSGSAIMLIFVKLLSFFILSEINLINLIALAFTGVATYLIYIVIIDFKHTRFLKEEFRNRIANFRNEIVLNKR